MAGYARDRNGFRMPVAIPQGAIGISHSDGVYCRGSITSRRTGMAIGSILEQWRLIREWSPVLKYGQDYLATQDPHARALVIGDAAEWLVSKTENKLDDKYVGHVVEILKSPQGEALVRDIVADLQAVTSAVERAK